MTELFDLAQWHSTDPIHFRALICADIAAKQSGRKYLDYGSGIGSDALVFASNTLVECSVVSCIRAAHDVLLTARKMTPARL